MKNKTILYQFLKLPTKAALLFIFLNFNILPEKEKHEIINIMLDLISNVQVDNTKYFTKDDL